MNKLFKLLSFSAVAMSAAMLPSCSLEEPFKTGGEGSLTILTEINGDVIKTRAAIGEEELAILRENCIIYIENNKGVIRKFKGVDNIPQEIRLQTGSYIAEAWSGDSVSASFTQKFYRGYETFEIKEGNQSLTLNCNIANVVVSVDPSSLNIDLNDMKVTFSHSRGSLEFDEQAVLDEKKGYFMMPNADSDLTYKIEGTKLDGTPYEREGKIQNVQRAHEYSLTLKQNDNATSEGGAFIRVEIADIPLIETVVEILPAPSIKGLGFNMDEQINNLDNEFEDVYVYVKGYEQLSSVLLTFGENFTDSQLGKEMNIFNNKPLLEEKGISFRQRSSTEAANDDDVVLDEVIITFSKTFLNSLPVSESEYDILVEGVDKRHRVGQATLRIVTSRDAVEVMAPVSSLPMPSDDLMAVKAYSATVPGIVNDVDIAVNYGIKYRKQGATEWSEAYPQATRATSRNYTVKLTNLEPNTTYEYISFCDGFNSPDVQSFKTEEIYKIPNASFEDWGTYGNNIVVPGLTGDKTTSFWGSGNEGSALARLTLTDKTEELVRTGKYAAKLASNKALGVLAAGNIFTGEFSNIKNLKYGVIKVGRQYNATHPSKVRVYCNYRPGSVDCTASSAPLKSGDSDQGQIYIGIVTEPLSLDTYVPSTLFSPQNYSDKLIAYGEVTLTQNYGANGELLALDIPFEYYQMAKTTKPGYLVIVATASKYGDYYAGSSKSVMILDDIELIYE